MVAMHITSTVKVAQLEAAEFKAHTFNSLGNFASQIKHTYCSILFSCMFTHFSQLHWYSSHSPLAEYQQSQC